MKKAALRTVAEVLLRHLPEVLQIITVHRAAVAILRLHPALHPTLAPVAAVAIPVEVVAAVAVAAVAAAEAAGVVAEAAAVAAVEAADDNKTADGNKAV